MASYLIIAWIPLTLFAFPAFQKQRGMLVTLLLGLLFLPEVGSPGAVLAGVQEVKVGPLHFTKDLTISYALFFSVLIYDLPLLLSGRPRWFDLPMLVWCLCPVASALTNDPPPDGSWAIRDGVSQALIQATTWGIPYLIGRLYFTGPAAFRDLALGVVLAALIYVPFCLFEVRFSPQLHRAVYGFAQHNFNQTLRFGGYRAMVFFKHGLTLAFWMVSALLIAAWLVRAWPRDRARQFLVWSLIVLVPATILSKSTGALLLGIVGWGVLSLSRLWPTRLWLVLLMAVAPLYISLRTSGAWSGQGLVKLVRENLDESRAQSLEFRLDNEDMLIERALEQPGFGWGGWGRNRIHDKRGKDVSVTDGLWIIALGDRGFTGLIAVEGVLLLPALCFAFRFSPRSWSRESVAPAVVCAAVVSLWAIDQLLNGGFNQTYALMAGALAGLDPKRFLNDELRAPALLAPTSQYAEEASLPAQQSS